MPDRDEFDPYLATTENGFEPGNKRVRQQPVQDFAIREVINRSWQILRCRYWATIGAILLSTVLGGLLGSIGGSMQPNDEKAEPNGLGVLLILIGVLVNLYMHCGLMNYLVNLASGRRAEVGDIFRAGGVLPKAIFSVLLYGLAVMGLGVLGFVLIAILAQGAAPLAILFVPVWIFSVIILGIRLSQFFYLLVDRDVTALESLQLSWKIMEGRIVQFLQFSLVLAILNICGLVTLVGWVVTGPLTYVATAVYYLGVTGQPVADPYAVAQAGGDDFV